MEEIRWKSLDEVRDEASVCCRCDLCHGRTHVVFGEGPPGARALIVGEGPGREEDETGRPFMGRAGEYLNELLARAGVDRDSLWITNIVRCRPTISRNGLVDNRAPKGAEIRACDIWTSATYRFVNPEIVMCLGGAPAQILIHKSFRVDDDRGVWHEGREGKLTAATYHPAYVQRFGGENRRIMEELMIEDFRMLRSKMEELRKAA